MPRPLLAVIMPRSNTERFIVGSVESVLAHAVVDWKLAIVDDTSSDGTLDNYRRSPSYGADTRLLGTEPRVDTSRAMLRHPWNS